MRAGGGCGEKLRRLIFMAGISAGESRAVFIERGLWVAVEFHIVGVEVSGERGDVADAERAIRGDVGAADGGVPRELHGGARPF